MQQVPDLLELLSDQTYQLPIAKNEKLELAPYGYRWFRTSAIMQVREQKDDKNASADKN